MRGKDCAGEVQIVERTLSMKEATRDFPKNQSFVVCTRREEGAEVWKGRGGTRKHVACNMLAPSAVAEGNIFLSRECASIAELFL